MAALGLNANEIRQAVRACAHIRVPDPAPEYLQRFLTARLEARSAELAVKVARLTPPEALELFRVIRSLQRIGRDT